MLNSQKKTLDIFLQVFYNDENTGAGMGNCPPEISKMIKIIYLGGKMYEGFSREERLIGKENVEKLKKKINEEE